MRFQRGFPADQFNRIVESYCRWVPFAGTRVLLDRVARGWRLSLANLAGWRHPWFTAPSWNADKVRWEARVGVGFVNGIDPLVDGATDDGSAQRLLDDPAIVLHGFRPLGNDEGEDAPKYFQVLGVRKNSGAIQFDGDSISIDATDRSNPNDLPPRRLVAVDFVLSCARAALTSQVYIADPTATSGQEVLYRVGYDTTRVEGAGSRARLRLEQKYVAPVKPTIEERLLGLVDDPTEDTILISTVYLLSPANFVGDPDGTWTPYVAHSTFWNLKHAARNLTPKEPPPPLRLFTGLLGGVGDSIGNQILAQINEFSDRVNNAVNNASNEGKFWTV